MEQKDLIGLIEYTLETKIRENDMILKYSFYELRVKYNLSENETDKFLELLTNKISYMGYKVYFTGDEFEINGVKSKVTNNELIIAIKQ